MIKKLAGELHPKLSNSIQVSGIQYDSRKISQGDLFVAVPGFKVDAATFVPGAFSQGASAAIIHESARIPAELEAKCARVSDVRKTLAEVAQEFYSHPTQKMLTLGVTGTKGKTSSTYLLDAILLAAGNKTALLGTVECKRPTHHFASSKTTMEAPDVLSFLSDAQADGVDTATIEVSSHALSLNRVWGIEFSGAIFTNLLEDHLDFYHTMEKYFEAKRLLFHPPYLKSGAPAAIHIGNDFGRRLAQELGSSAITFGEKTGMYSLESCEMSDRGIQMRIRQPNSHPFEIFSPFVGETYVMNILGVVALARSLGISEQAIQKGLAIATTPGRMELIATRLPFSVYVDFAHNGPALESILASLKKVCQGRVIAVFGAGGDRDVTRRMGMGAAAAREADYSFITSDNPRTENPQKIIDAIEKSFLESGGAKSKYSVLVDRRQAIEEALRFARPNDMVCIAGKGHEVGQIIGQEVFPFDDREEARKILRQMEVQ